MKAIVTILVSLLIFGLHMPSDYRDAYVGTYFCNQTCNVVNSAGTGLENVSDTVSLTVAKANEDSAININIRSASYKVKLTGRKMSRLAFAHFAGMFYSTDSINFSVKPGIAPTLCNYRGKKK